MYQNSCSDVILEPGLANFPPPRGPTPPILQTPPSTPGLRMPSAMPPGPPPSGLLQHHPHLGPMLPPPPHDRDHGGMPPHHPHGPPQMVPHHPGHPGMPPHRVPPYMGQPDYRVFEINKRLQQRTDDCDNLWWDSFATEFFEDDATLTVSFMMEEGPKRFTIGRTLIPRYFRSIFDSGCSELYYLLRMTRESFHNTSLTLDAENANMVMTLTRPFLTTVVVEGRLILEFTFDDLMRIRAWTFQIRTHRELVLRSMLGMQDHNFLEQLSKNLTRNGVTTTTLNFFRLCVILEPMQELMSRQKAYSLTPRDCLKTTLFQKWQRMVAPPGQPHKTETSRQPSKRRKRKASNANSDSGSGRGSSKRKQSPVPTLPNMAQPGDVMIVGEPTLMGGDFGDEDERLITRLENTQYDGSATPGSSGPAPGVPHGRELAPQMQPMPGQGMQPRQGAQSMGSRSGPGGSCMPDQTCPPGPGVPLSDAEFPQQPGPSGGEGSRPSPLTTSGKMPSPASQALDHRRDGNPGSVGVPSTTPAVTVPGQNNPGSAPASVCGPSTPVGSGTPGPSSSRPPPELSAQEEMSAAVQETSSRADPPLSHDGGEEQGAPCLSSEPPSGLSVSTDPVAPPDTSPAPGLPPLAPDASPAKREEEGRSAGDGNSPAEMWGSLGEEEMIEAKSSESAEKEETKHAPPLAESS